MHQMCFRRCTGKCFCHVKCYLEGCWHEGEKEFTKGLRRQGENFLKQAAREVEGEFPKRGNHTTERECFLFLIFVFVL